MASTRIRSFVKGICWESIGFIITVFAVYLVYGNLKLSVEFSLVLTAVKIFFFFVHERAWKRVSWGKYQMVKGKKVRG